MNNTIPVLCNSDFDLSKFDFSFKDIRILYITSKTFRDYIEFQQPDFLEGNMSFINSIIETIHSEFDRKLVIIKNNPKDGFDYNDILNVYKLLLIVFPSDLQIEYEITYYYEKGSFHRGFM